jgi:hypothetical protein
MPKATLTYDLDQPEDQQEFDLVNNARKYYSVLWDIDQYMRNQIKYSSDDTPELYRETIQMVRDEFWKLMESHNIDLDR